jgi:hypothetical protein
VDQKFGRDCLGWMVGRQIENKFLFMKKQKTELKKERLGQSEIKKAKLTEPYDRSRSGR